MLVIFGMYTQLSECQKRWDVMPYDETIMMTSEILQVRCQ